VWLFVHVCACVPMCVHVCAYVCVHPAPSPSQLHLAAAGCYLQPVMVLAPGWVFG